MQDANGPGLAERNMKALGAAGRNLRDKRKVAANTTDSCNDNLGERSDNKCHLLLHYKCAEILANRNLG